MSSHFDDGDRGMHGYAKASRYIYLTLPYLVTTVTGALISFDFSWACINFSRGCSSVEQRAAPWWKLTGPASHSQIQVLPEKCFCDVHQCIHEHFLGGLHNFLFSSAGHAT